MREGQLEISEVGSGEVNRVRIRNLSGRRVFIMDGEELVGAKQNRVLNTSVMIAPKQVAVVPVSCVEQGRWVASSPGFRSGETQLFAAGRQANIAAVSRNYVAQPSAGAQSDQSMIWRKVAEKRAAFQLGSPSGPMHEVYESNQKSVTDYVKRFRPIEGQVGAVFAINGEIVGADIFDQSSTLRRLLPKLIKSYALDALEKQTSRSIAPPLDRHDAEMFLRRVMEDGVSFRCYDSPGEGQDVRIISRRISGAALTVSDRAVHVALFMPERDDRPIPLRDGRAAGALEAVIRSLRLVGDLLALVLDM